MQALMIGCGNMGSALLRRWLQGGQAEFTVIDPVAEFSHPGMTLHRDGDALPDRAFDLLIVAIKPQLIDVVIPQHIERLTKAAPVLSIAAGYSAARLTTLSAGRSVIRVMPNLPASLGLGVSGLFAAANVPDATLQMVTALMRTTGEVIRVATEEDLDGVTAIAGSGPGFVFEIARAYIDAARSLGFDDEQARTLVLGTLAGAVELARQSGRDLADLRDSVTSKAGTTAAGLRALNAKGELSDLMHATVRAAYDRAVELR